MPSTPDERPVSELRLGRARVVAVAVHLRIATQHVGAWDADVVELDPSVVDAVPALGMRTARERAHKCVRMCV